MVADEVRKLAERSQRETKAIAALVRMVQTGARDAVGAMAQGARKVELGAAKADEAGEALGEMLQAVAQNSAAMEQVSAQAEELAAMVERLKMLVAQRRRTDDWRGEPVLAAPVVRRLIRRVV